MKKHNYLLVWLYSTITILSIVFVVMDNLGIDFQYLKLNLWRFEKLFFSILLLIVSVTLLLLLLWILLEDISKRGINQNLRRILNNQPIKLEETSELNINLIRLSKKMFHMTNSLQKKRKCLYFRYPKNCST